ncbi:hypothetical protein C6Y14_25205 [Streptomyces dioscori]|uniref:Uncharacterized protein n=1 Tax=Streptomyces dioscori TaxID=2109333 RepID=A0A2P8Q3F3_9ACTN|nr:hypothetical protein C6Y14_25205 [Streptomyces dioscori]
MRMRAVRGQRRDDQRVRCRTRGEVGSWHPATLTWRPNGIVRWGRGRNMMSSRDRGVRPRLGIRRCAAVLATLSGLTVRGPSTGWASLSRQVLGWRWME